MQTTSSTLTEAIGLLPITCRVRFLLGQVHWLHNGRTSKAALAHAPRQECLSFSSQCGQLIHWLAGPRSAVFGKSTQSRVLVVCSITTRHSRGRYLHVLGAKYGKKKYTCRLAVIEMKGKAKSNLPTFLIKQLFPFRATLYWWESRLLHIQGKLPILH